MFDFFAGHFCYGLGNGILPQGTDEFIPDALLLPKLIMLSVLELNFLHIPTCSVLNVGTGNTIYVVTFFEFC